ncbi:hypothetical protein EUGRSUZ_I02467 [Eucalyptus grandis]|uniref:Uncharacterized protein n=2 Tax=Eucalyptus grandis TaxID=71139 RepID=A0ACC3JJ98_EUCGR|nr:hypothetical protein EUGRSUZ_I02467 [Eucalyptus grandis]
MKFDQVTITLTNTKLHNQSHSTATFKPSWLVTIVAVNLSQGTRRDPTLALGKSEKQHIWSIQACTKWVGSKQQHQLRCTPWGNSQNT